MQLTVLHAFLCLCPFSQVVHPPLPLLPWVLTFMLGLERWNALPGGIGCLFCCVALFSFPSSLWALLRIGFLHLLTCFLTFLFFSEEKASPQLQVRSEFIVKWGVGRADLANLGPEHCQFTRKLMVCYCTAGLWGCTKDAVGGGAGLVPKHLSLSGYCLNTQLLRSLPCCEFETSLYLTGIPWRLFPLHFKHNLKVDCWSLPSLFYRLL